MSTQNLIWVDGVAYKLVPIDPTDEMIEAGWAYDDISLRRRYKAMLKAAPQPTKEKL